MRASERCRGTETSRLVKLGEFGWCVLAWLLASACKEPASLEERHESTPQAQLQEEPLQALPPAPREDANRVALGRQLFAERRLSADGTVACVSCHILGQAGQDGRKVSLGVHQRAGSVNAPSVLNAGFNFVQFWDGRAATLEDQVSGPLTNPAEMGGDWARTLGFLKTDASYSAAFARAFGDGVTETNIRSAFAAYERTLVTPDSRFDRWLRGEKGALSPDELAGYERFKSVGCVACHQGANVGGNMFQRFGVMGEYFVDRGHIEQADYGRFNVTHQEQDRFVFRVPSLRNVALTAPYFHDGSAATLEQAVATMAKYQLGQTLDAPSSAQIVAFLKTLTGRLPGESPDTELAKNGVRP